jgi:hypothetical protein
VIRFLSVSPHPLPGWTLDPTKRFYVRGKGVKVFRAELVSIDTMELLAVVDALEQLPPLDARFYVDASYILYGTNKKNVAARDMLRRSNRPLWIRFTKVMSRRLVLRLHTYFVKCSSHGKGGGKQHPSIDLWNDRADTWAGNFATKGPFIHDWWPEGELDYHVLHRGKAVRGDVRAHIRSQFEEKHFSSALSTVGTRYPRSEQGQHKVLPIGGSLGEGRKATSTLLCLHLSEYGSSHAGQLLHV